MDPRRPGRRARSGPRSGPRRALAASFAALCACAGAKPVALGIRYDRLAPCSTAPNCVSSDSLDPSHRVPAFELRVPPDEAWPAACEAVAHLPHTRIVAVDEVYLHAEATRALDAVDDLELHLQADRGQIAVRSGARSGYTDLGANRRRVEELRAELVHRGIAPP
jgi:uncharacterized protein (DUF1499 family)